MQIRSCFILTAVLALGRCLSAEVLYTVTDLGTLPEDVFSRASGINNAGQVVGVSYRSNPLVGNPTYHAFLYSNGQMTDLGTLGGCCSEASGINNQGQVTGQSLTSTDAIRAFLYSNGQMTDLGSLTPGFSQGSGINNNGQVTGTSQSSTPIGSPHAFLYTSGQMVDLGTLTNGQGRDGSGGSGVNDGGQVTGWSYTATSARHGFLYTNGQMIDIGTLGGPDYPGTSGVAINNGGEITGWSQTPGDPTHAFLYDNGDMRDLGTLQGYSESAGSAINDAGQVVGYASNPNGASHAFLYKDGQMTDLNNAIDSELKITLSAATGINEKGQIVANGSGPSGSHGYLLTPIGAACASPVIGNVSATPDVLWPPDHRFVQVAIGYTVDDACGSKCQLTISSNEFVRGKGDGNTSADWRVVDAHQVELRAERDGNGSGRVYKIHISCVNDADLRSWKTVDVSVPHDRRH